MHIKITKGLDIPIQGKPEGALQSLPAPVTVSLDLRPFQDISLRLLVKTGDEVTAGQPLAEDKNCPGRMFVSPSTGSIAEIRRGEKRSLLDIVINVSKEEKKEIQTPFDFKSATKEALINHLKLGGLFAHIRSRPFNLLADPSKEPRSIFVKALESDALSPPCELQVAGHEKDFQTGLDCLARLTKGDVHLVYAKDCSFSAFTDAKNVQKHTAEGPHPVGTFSVFIAYIDPIKTINDLVWTLECQDVVILGHFLNTGTYLTERVISIAGPGIEPDKTGYFKIHAGYPVEDLISNRLKNQKTRLISGNLLTGREVEKKDFIGFQDTCFSAVPESTEREFLHFFRLGVKKFSFSKAYFSGLFRSKKKEYPFTTSLQGEPRPFIDPSLYDKVMPLPIPTMQLIKAIMAGDFDFAEELGLLEVDSEDFALASFVCPSKIEFCEIVKNGQREYLKT